MIITMEGRKAFSRGSDAYAMSRPRYPLELFDWIASICDAHETAWDCATGNGQAALGLARHFKRVEATDISCEQIEQSFPVANVSYSVRPAEETHFPAGSFDLVAVAQALHWLDLPRFWNEVRRTAKSNGFFCAWGYAWFDCDPSLQEAFFAPIRRVLEPYWARENLLLWKGYRSEDILFPFERLEAPPFAIELNWGMEMILRYVQSWSAYKRAVTHAQTRRMIARIEEDANRRFEGSEPLLLSAPLSVVAGRVA